MKTCFTHLLIACIYTIPIYAGTQQDPALSPDSILKKKRIFSSCLSWELQLGSSFLTHTSLSANRPLASSKTMSGSFFTSITFPFENKETERRTHYSVNIGIGT